MTLVLIATHLVAFALGGAAMVAYIVLSLYRL